jgi:pimeloyl-ACP methyl ester carboxylesterase
MVRALGAQGALAPGRTTTTLLSGYGRPARWGASLAPADLAAEVLAQVGAGPFVVVALSAGCQVAAHVALQAPDRVASLVLIGPTTDPRAATWPRLVRRWLSTARHESPRQLPVLLRQYRRTGLRSMVRAMDAARRDRIESVLPLLACPVLTLSGRHDAIAPADWLVHLTEPADRVTDGSTPTRRHHRLGSGAHLVPWTHGAEVARLVGDFLARAAR